MEDFKKTMEDFNNPQVDRKGMVSTSGVPRASDIRFAARLALTGNWKMAILLTAIAMTVTFAGVYLLMMLMNWAMMPLLKAAYSGAGITTDMLITPMLVMIGVGLVTILISSFTTLAAARISRRLAMYEKLDFSALRIGLGDLFKGFRMSWVVAWRSAIIPMLIMYAVMIVDVVLAYTTKLPEGFHMMLLLAGMAVMMVMVYRRMFSYVPIYQMWAIDSDATARELANRSRELMAGHRWRLFCLNMSFFGWVLLYGVAGGIVEEMLSAPEYLVALEIFTYVWMLASIPLVIYIQTAVAVFVRDLMVRKGMDASDAPAPAEEAPAQAESAEVAAEEVVTDAAESDEEK